MIGPHMVQYGLGSALGAIRNAGPNLFQNTDQIFILALDPWEVSTNTPLSRFSTMKYEISEGWNIGWRVV